ncbi:MFS transporter [Mucilaginibacter rubeus]|uniref:MFS transporter n=1 Tax=Mucilaginibacter rubeus TaxID=2027860 RepID=A0AAE6JFF6_9SPHI|nr:MULTISPECIES: MFS transporter [Mucilaginibacter]QEM04035.1 MFS transporter [Mucilaginibacter rubeus]QEM16637.1 MFS transporter [Mucilaginibacter gossypii]QTE46889.1 MFS transporter [Mucilaginibacter rubeus]QTE53487.1 MFS transporter [Mucilaginibacter rubeus]QTE58573.1 MFS transporter [Mucilaginibacter rubeus]
MNEIKSPIPQTTGGRIKSIIGGSLGNLVEWYDWYAYTAFSLYFSDAFFPSDNQTVQLLNTAGIFAIGFLMRPIGGWVMGTFADKRGRKTALTFSVLLMSVGSLIIAITPGYKTIGVAAPILLVLARIIQGLSVGGEYGTSATYLSEMATKKHRGFYSSFQYVTLIMGQLLALGVLVLLQRAFLSEKQLHDWGWRIPFGIGAILAVTTMYLRRSLQESASFDKESKKADDLNGTIKALAKHPKAVFTVIGLTIGGTLAFYTFTTYMQKFLVNTSGFSKSAATLISTLTLAVFMVIQPLFGLLSDKIGRKPLLIGFGILGTLCTIPIMTLLSHTKDVSVAFALILCALVIVSGYTSINAVVKAELFPANVRALGVGFPYAIAVSLFGGTAEYIALWFKNEHHAQWFYWYVTVCIALSLVLYITMNDTRKYSKMEEE